MKLMVKFRSTSIRRQMLISFSLLVTLLIVLIMFLTTNYLSRQLLERRELENRQVALHISHELDSQIENLESAKRQFLYSSDTMLVYTRYLSTTDIKKKSAALDQTSAALYRVMNNGVPQIYLIAVHGSDGNAISAHTGKRYTLLWDTAAQRMEALNDPSFVLGTTISPPESTEGGMMVRMLVRFASAQTKQRALLEVQQKYSVFSGIIENAIRGTEKSVVVYDGDQNVIYPLGLKKEDTAYYQALNGPILDRGSSGERELVTAHYAKIAGWNVVVYEPESVYQQPIVQIRITVLYLGGVAFLISLALVYFLSKKLTAPLYTLHADVQKIGIESLGRVDRSASPQTYNEYEQLRNSFDEMRVNLSASIDAYLEARREQSKTLLLALQSKMHPHFINNVLASIQIMAEHGDYRNVIEICKHLSEMLSYTMANYDGMVPLRSEIEYAKNYIDLMTIRYGERLACSFEIPPEMLDIPVPKMILQPLVENSIKHGMRPEGLKVFIAGGFEADRYFLSVVDNGVGFSREMIALCRDLSSLAQLEAPTPEQGIGFVNIVKRLLLYYKNEAVFVVESENGKTTVKIGGVVRGDISDERG